MEKCTCGEMPVLVNDFGKADNSVLPSIFVGCAFCEVYTKRFTYILDLENAEHNAISKWNKHVLGGK